MNRERFCRAEHVPRARRAREIEAREIEHRRRLARRVNERRSLAEHTPRRQNDARDNGRQRRGKQHVNGGLPTARAERQAAFALVVGNSLERLLNNAHQNGQVEHRERQSARQNAEAPAHLQHEEQKSEQANHNGGQRRERLDSGFHEMRQTVLRGILGKVNRAAKRDRHRNEQREH